MFGRFVGHYELADAFVALSAGEAARQALCRQIGAAHGRLRLFARGRDALYAAMLDWKARRGSGMVAAPAWGCPIVTAVIAKAGHTPLLIDVAPHTLHMEVAQVCAAHAATPLIGAVLVAENGAGWDAAELAPLRVAGIPVLLDYALAWGAALGSGLPEAEFCILSGGFSKPISGLGLGVLLSRDEVTAPPLAAAPSTLAKALLTLPHRLLQTPTLYRCLRPIVPADLESQYDGVCRAAAPASCAMALRSIERWRRGAADRLALLARVRGLLLAAGRASPLLHCPSATAWSKALFEARGLPGRRHGQIEYHHQYPYDLRSDPRVRLLDCDYEGVRAIRERHVSFAINASVIQRSDAFLAALQRDLHVSG